MNCCELKQQVSQYYSCGMTGGLGGVDVGLGVGVGGSQQHCTLGVLVRGENYSKSLSVASTLHQH